MVRTSARAASWYGPWMRSASLLLTSLLAACAVSPSPRPFETHTLVLLRTGPRTGLTKEQQQAVFAGHMANMQRLARAGDLLLAGPFGREKSAADLRGLFVMASPDPAEALRLAETDPGVVEGVFRLECQTLATDHPLRALLEAELAAEDENARMGRKLQPGEFGRGYVLLTATDGAVAERLWHGHPKVLLFARLEGGRALAVVDAENKQALGSAEGLGIDAAGSVSVDEWFATRRLAGR